MVDQITKYHLLLHFMRKRYARVLSVERLLVQFETYLDEGGYNDQTRLAGRPTIYPLRSMQPNDFIVLQAKDHNVSAAVAAYYKRHGRERRYTTRKVDETTTILRRVK